MNLATLVVSISEKSSAVNAKQPFLTRLGKEFSEGLEHFGEFVSDSVLGADLRPAVAGAAGGRDCGREGGCPEKTQKKILKRF